jgi:hypothetical protein
MFSYGYSLTFSPLHSLISQKLPDLAFTASLAHTLGKWRTTVILLFDEWSLTVAPMFQPSQHLAIKFSNFSPI